MHAYEDALNATSRAHAPWYAIPADDKPFMRLTVAEIIVDALSTLDLAYPVLGEQEMSRLSEAREALVADHPPEP